MKETALISVIVPVFNDIEGLKKCLKALECQSYPLSQIEVLIIDNHLEKKVSLDSTKFSRFEIFHQPLPGSYASRNMGAKNARGDYLFFTDSDCVPAPKWIEAGFQRARRDLIVGGHIEHVYRNDERPNISELYERIFYFNQELTIENESYAATANLIVHRETFWHVGAFDPILRTGGDREWCHRAQKRDLKISYEREAVVYHPTRSTLKPFLKRRIRLISGVIYLRYREKGLNKEDFQEIRSFYLKKNFMKKWNLDWHFFNSLPYWENKKVWTLFRTLNLFDLVIIMICKQNYDWLKRMTLIDRYNNEEG